MGARLRRGGTVGAVADWYAVVALFRHPFGIPVPHTAVIPRNQQRIAENLATFVEQFPGARTDRGPAADAQYRAVGGGWLAAPGNSRALADPAVDALPALLRVFDDDEVARRSSVAPCPACALDVSGIAGHLLQILTETQRHQPLLERADGAGSMACRQRRAAAGQVQRGIALHAGAARRLYRQQVHGSVIALLHEVRSPSIRCGNSSTTPCGTSSSGRTSDRYRRIGRLWMRDFLRHLEREDSYRALWQQLRDWISADALRQDGSRGPCLPICWPRSGPATIGLAGQAQRLVAAWSPVHGKPLPASGVEADRGSGQGLGRRRDQPQDRAGDRQRPAVHIPSMAPLSAAWPACCCMRRCCLSRVIVLIEAVLEARRSPVPVAPRHGQHPGKPHTAYW
jgi:hypothetical protein